MQKRKKPSEINHLAYFLVGWRELNPRPHIAQQRLRPCGAFLVHFSPPVSRIGCSPAHTNRQATQIDLSPPNEPFGTHHCNQSRSCPCSSVNRLTINAAPSGTATTPAPAAPPPPDSSPRCSAVLTLASEPARPLGLECHSARYPSQLLRAARWSVSLFRAGASARAMSDLLLAG